MKTLLRSNVTQATSSLTRGLDVTYKNAEMQGRLTGSIQWRRMRGELGTPSESESKSDDADHPLLQFVESTLEVDELEQKKDEGVDLLKEWVRLTDGHRKLNKSLSCARISKIEVACQNTGSVTRVSMTNVHYSFGFVGKLSAVRSTTCVGTVPYCGICPCVCCCCILT